MLVIINLLVLLFVATALKSLGMNNVMMGTIQITLDVYQIVQEPFMDGNARVETKHSLIFAQKCVAMGF